MTARALDRFKIDIFKLSNATHDYQFEITNAFFENFPESSVTAGKGKVEAKLDKSELLLRLSLCIDVTVQLECDRSLDEFDYPIKVERDILFKYGEEEEELDDDVVVITKNTQQLNLAQYIYEFIEIEIPMKKLHPRFQDEHDEDEIIFTSDSDSETKDEATDPRWEQLKNLK